MVSDERRRTIYNVIPSTTFGPLVKGKDISLVIEDYPEGIGEKFGIPSLNTKDLSEIGGGIKSLNWSKIRDKAISKFSTHPEFSKSLKSASLNVLVMPFGCGGKNLWAGLNKRQFLSQGSCCGEINSVWVAHPARSGSNVSNFNLVNKGFDFCRAINPLVKEILTTERPHTLLMYKNGDLIPGVKSQFALVQYTYVHEIHVPARSR